MARALRPQEAASIRKTRRGLLRLARVERRFALRFTARGATALALYEVVRFGAKKAWACLFPALLLALMAGTFLLYPRDAPLHRYDVITIGAIVIQATLLWLKFETPEEARLIAVYHLLGTVMELVKTAQGSWVYPEPNVLRIAGVPLFSGFLYSSIGSFMVRTWHLFDFRFERHPPLWLMTVISVLIYAYFMLNRWLPDLRVPLYATAMIVLLPCTIHFKVWRVHRRMPMLVAALLTAFFIYLAETIGTASRAWIYPSQTKAWSPVPLRVYFNWFVMMFIAYTLVVWLKRNEINEVAIDLAPLAHHVTGDVRR